MYKILVVEDEKPINDLIRINLSDAGYACECVFDGLQAADKILTGSYDLILLDIMLPEIEGYELMEYIRPKRTPVIFLTAKDRVYDRVRGLKAGADDYLTKPFEIIELLARVEAVLRRYNRGSESLKIEDIEVDILSRTVTKAGEPISLTKKEFDLLVLFIRNRNIALFRENIYETVWNDEYAFDSRTVDLHVQRLRKKLGLEKTIVSVYKVGYRMEI